MEILGPYLLYLGDVKDPISAKTARGIAAWRPELCIGEYARPGTSVSVGVPTMSIREAAAKGAKTLVIGIAPGGGEIAPSWIGDLLEALDAGLDIASGLHRRLSEVSEIKERAAKLGRQLIDVRHPKGSLIIGNGKKRPGMRLLTVGTDCAVGKMYTSLALTKSLVARGVKATFRATGQTGIFIAGEGISVDAVVADFISGAIEQLSPANDPDHWDIIEGQGSLYHPAFAGVSLGLLHGAQPDCMVLCHEPTRPHIRHAPGFDLPGLGVCMEANLWAARLTNPAAKFIGISLNTSSMDRGEAEKLCAKIADEHGLPCVDPVAGSIDPIADHLIETYIKTGLKCAG